MKGVTLRPPGWRHVAICCDFLKPCFWTILQRCCYIFPLLAEPGVWKNVPPKHLKPIWRHVAKKTHLETTKITEKRKKTIPIEDQIGALAADFCGHFALGASMRGHLGAKISKTCAMICRGCQNTPKWCNQCFQSVREWFQGSKNRGKSIQWGAFP